VRYFRGEENLGAIGHHELIEGRPPSPYRSATTWPTCGRAAIVLDTLLPVYDTFTLGGPISMPGLNLGELRGNSYWSAQASYLQKVADISVLFGHSLYMGLTLTAADMSGRIDFRTRSRSIPVRSCWEAERRSARLTLSLALTSQNEWQFVFGLGRPIEERTITDPVW
jgi:hypothetical protein